MSGLMQALVYYAPNDLRLEARPIPEVRPDEVLLRVLSTGICATDLRIYHGLHRKYTSGVARVPGHEVVGELAQVGARLKGLREGQRVMVAPNWGCGRCRQCLSGRNNLCADYDAIGITLDGSFAEYVCIPSPAVVQGNLIPIPEELDPAAGVSIEPFACVLHGQDVLKIRPGEVVLVIGAGPIGLMHVLLARLRGAGMVLVSELVPERAGLARQLGAEVVVNPVEEDLPGTIARLTGGAGVDVVIVAVASPQAQAVAVELAAVGGRINFFGGLPKDRPLTTLDANLIHYKELVITGTTGCSTADCHRAAQIVAAGQVNLLSLVEARFPLAQALEAFQLAESGKALKVILEPGLL